MGFVSNQVERPASKYIEWSGSKGRFYYYDKEKKENVLLPKTFQFVPLDQLSTVKGYSEKNKSGIVAREVRYVGQNPLTVRTFNGVEIAEGIWREIKPIVESAGGKFCNSVYALLLDTKGNHEVVNFQLYGSGIGSWIDAKIKAEDQVVVTASTNPKKDKKGSNEYFVPQFDSKPIPSDELREQCVDIYTNKLVPYFEQYELNKSSEEEEDTQSTDSIRNAPDPEVRQPVSAELDDELEDGLDPLPF